MGRFRRRLLWHSREDGAQWAQFQLNSAPAVSAISEIGPDRYSVNVIIELPGTWSTALEAQRALEDWASQFEQETIKPQQLSKSRRHRG